MEEFAIYFDDLKEDVQKQLLDFYGLNDAKEGNFDVYEIATITKYEEE